MINKERYLKFIKDFNLISIFNICEELKKDKSSFYTCRLSLENMQVITDEIRKRIKVLYPDVNDDEFILNTKEKNVDFVKDINEININKICNKYKIFTNAIYSLECSETKYELVVNEIKNQLDEIYKKYSK